MAIRATLKIAGQHFDILRCRYGFRRVTDSKGYPGGGASKGEILVSLESTPDNLLLEKLLTKNPVNVPGSLEFWNEDESSRIRVLEWEEGYIYSAGEDMVAGSPLPMTMTLGITPLRLDINRNIRIDRRSTKTYGFWWEEYKPEEEAVIESTTERVLVSSVEGPDSGYVNQKLKYKVTGYSISPEETDRKNVKWKVKVDDGETDLSQHGEEIELKLRPEWLGKTITVMPYLDNPSPDVSVKTEVKRFKTLFFARSNNWAGLNAAGSKAEDMMCGNETPEEVLKINRLFKIQLGASIDELFAEMYLLTGAGSLKRGNDNAKALVNHFRSNTGAIFSSAYMDKKLKNHATLKEFVYGERETTGIGVLQLLCEQLRIHNGDIQKIRPQIGEINSTRVKFDTLTDKLNGMTISVDDTSAYQVYIDDFMFVDDNTFNCKIRIEIYDHYGLDRADVEKYGLGAGFRAWYVLQHVKGYKPFLTRLNCVISVENQKF